MDISQVPELIENTAWPLIIETYDTKGLVYPMLGEVLPVTDDTLHGERGQTVTRIGRPKRIKHGQEIPADQFDSGHTWRLQTNKFAHRIDLPFEFVRGSDAAGRIANIIAEHTTRTVELHMETKEDFIADMYQKGTLTAGDLDFFDGSFPNETDTAPKFIYDALPWFDTAHPLAVGAGTFSNHIAAAVLNDANLRLADTRMRVTNAVDERGERVKIRPDTLLVPAGALGFDASVLLESLLKTASANNDKNVHQGKYNLIEWANLDDAASASAWWLGVAGKGLRIRDSGAPRVTTFVDEKHEVVSVKWVTYFGAAVTDWRFWMNNNKAAA